MKTANYLIALALLSALGSFLVRYFFPLFPAEGVNRHLVDSRLQLIQGGAIVAAVLVGLASGLRQASKKRAIAIVALSLAVIAAYVLATHEPPRPTTVRDRSTPKLPSRYEFTTDWTTGYDKQWRKTLAAYKDKPDTHALEIGSFEGRSTIWFLENILTGPGSSITAIDPWSGTYERVDDFEERFNRNMKAYDGQAKIIKLKGYSQDVLPKLQGQRYDFIYIDGSHFSTDALTDAVMTWPLLKPGGHMIFDDYHRWNFRQRIYPFRTATRGIDAFADIFQREIDVEHSADQLIVRKRINLKPLPEYPKVRAVLEMLQVGGWGRVLQLESQTDRTTRGNKPAPASFLAVTAVYPGRFRTEPSRHSRSRQSTHPCRSGKLGFRSPVYEGVARPQNAVDTGLETEENPHVS